MTHSSPINEKQDPIEVIDCSPSFKGESRKEQQEEKIQQERFAILVIDMQNDFLKGNLKCERATQIIPNIRILIDTARRKQIPIFYCTDEHLPIDTYEMKVMGPSRHEKY